MSAQAPGRLAVVQAALRCLEAGQDVRDREADNVHGAAGPGGRPLTLAQSGAIVVYACEKAGKFIPVDGTRRDAGLPGMRHAPQMALLVVLGQRQVQ